MKLIETWWLFSGKDDVNESNTINIIHLDIIVSLSAV